MKKIIQGLWLTIAFISTAYAQTKVPFTSERWNLPEGQVMLETYQGKESLLLKGGIAYLEDTDFEDGIIEFDVAFEEGRGFIGMIFRQQDRINYEEFYMRPHQSGNPDATQYTPVLNGLSGWQLYFGPGFSTAFTYDFDTWMHVKLVVSGDQAEVYIRDMETPVLFMHDLKRETKAGGLGLKVNANMTPGHYANFTYQKMKNPPLKGSFKDEFKPHSGQIKNWSVSQPFSDNWFNQRLTLNDSDRKGWEWTKLEAEPDGLANFSRLWQKTNDMNAVFAKVELTATEDHIQPLELAFSDKVIIYVNGRIIYSGTDGFRSRDYRFLGSIGYFDTVFLPLKKGENEVLIGVSEAFGGWGIKGRLLDFDKVKW
ncbi:MAG: hypothetical protein R3B93_11280 [Bacteroidia bacterium]